MSNLISVFTKVLPVIFLIITGNILCRINFLKLSTVNELKKIVVNITLPALLFFAFANTQIEKRYLLIFAIVFLTCGIMLFIGEGLKRLFKTHNRYFSSLFSGFETGMMGYSIYVAVFGAANMYKLAIMDLGQVTFVFFILVTYLQKQNGKVTSIRETATAFIKSPIIISIIVGILVGATGVYGSLESFDLSNSILEMLRLLSNLTVPLICMVIGFELRIDIKNLKQPLLSVCLRVGILMGLAVLINEVILARFLQLDSSFKVALYTLFLLPPPFVIPIYIKDEEEKDKQFVLNVISLHIIITLLAYMLLIALI